MNAEMESKKVFVGSFYEFGPEAVSCLACWHYTETKTFRSGQPPLPSMGKNYAASSWKNITHMIQRKLRRWSCEAVHQLR